MKKIKVIVKDKTTLELQENATVGDLIDLEELTELDTSYIDKLIEDGKDASYKKYLEQASAVLNTKHEAELDKLNSKLAEVEKDKEQEIKINIANLNVSHQKELDLLKSQSLKEKNDLINQNSILEEKIKSVEKQKELEIESKYQKQISDLNNSINMERQKSNNEKELLKSQLELEKTKALNDKDNEYKAQLQERDEQINQIQKQRAALNVKATGEDLESWCNNEVTSYMQNGLLNCTWIKDNEVIKDEDESKGSKADFIFKIYSNNLHKDEEIISSVCLDMKDENPESTIKQTNEHYYKQLDKNRTKKNCKYAVLVSNLELDKPNALPIFKVNDYPDMYVVRPAYLMVFLNMIASLSLRFATIVLSKEKELLELKDKQDILDAFNDIKNTYLDKPLALLEKEIDNISKQAEVISTASNKIIEGCSNISTKYINIIQDKLDKFEINLKRKTINKME